MKMVEVAFVERLMSMSYQRGHALWMCKATEPEDCHSHGCRREGQRIFAGEKDITHAVNWMVQRVLEVAVHATKVWRECYEKLAGPKGYVVRLKKEGDWVPGITKHFRYPEWRYSPTYISCM